MLRRFNLFTHRGTAVKFTHSSSHPSPLPNKSFFASSSPKPNSRTYPQKSYIFGAVGGIVVAASVREEEEEEEKDMAPLDLPGRPGNLTDEQTLRLKEMWTTAFKVFGVDTPAPLPDTASEVDSTPNVARSETDLSDTKEKKGKLKGMFKKKKDKESSPSPAPTPSSDVSADVSKLSIGDGDDKYSQTKEFKEAISTSSPQEIHDTFWRMVKADHPDSLFLRFLRARKWDVNKAIVMLVATMRWRSKELDVEDLVKKGELYSLETKDEGFLTQLRLGKSYLHGVDIHERPICLVRTRLHHSSDQQPEAIERFTVWEMETARLMLKGNVDTACVVFDMTGFTLSNMDYTPVKFLIKAFEAHYPESLGVCLVHKAPWVFQGIWNIIKGWLDPVVASKIHFTRSAADLEKFIPRPQLMKELEGDEQFEYKYIEPVPGENDIMKDTATRDQIQEERDSMVQRFEEATKQWIAGEEGAAAERDAVANELNENYWKLDPYIRARTLYDRIGAVGERGGFVYPKTEKKTKESEQKSEEPKVSE